VMAPAVDTGKRTLPIERNASQFAADNVSANCLMTLQRTCLSIANFISIRVDAAHPLQIKIETVLKATLHES
jgi:hypothetical protein